jgi:hypothetical protein
LMWQGLKMQKSKQASALNSIYISTILRVKKAYFF